MNSNDIARPRAFAIALAGNPMAPSSLPLCGAATAAAVRHSFFSFIEVIMVNECETMNREEKVNDEKESYYLAHMNERQPHHKTLI